MIFQLHARPNVRYKVIKILKQIEYKKVMPVLRWLAFFTAKILKKLYSGVLINETKFLKVS